MAALDPVSSDISAITTFGDSLTAFFTAALPPTANRIAAFQARAPFLYMLTRVRMERTAARMIQKNCNPVTKAGIVDQVKFLCSTLPADEQDSLIAILCIRFKVQ